MREWRVRFAHRWSENRWVLEFREPNNDHWWEHSTFETLEDVLVQAGEYDLRIPLTSANAT